IFDQYLKDQGYLAMGGQFVVASIIQAPRQRMTKEEKEKVKAGETPEDWQQNLSKLSQKDRDARWMVKYSKAKDPKGTGSVDLAIPLFGYKNHISTDKHHGFRSEERRVGKECRSRWATWQIKESRSAQ